MVGEKRLWTAILLEGRASSPAYLLDKSTRIQACPLVELYPVYALISARANRIFQQWAPDLGQCTSSPILTHSASQEVASRKACLAGNGPVLSKRRNAADGRFLARPKGAPLGRHCGVAILGKDQPFPADRVLHWQPRDALNVSILVTRCTIMQREYS